MWKELQDKIEALLKLIREEEITDGAIEGAVDRLSEALDLIGQKQYRKVNLSGLTVMYYNSFSGSADHLRVVKALDAIEADWNKIP